MDHLSPEWKLKFDEVKVKTKKGKKGKAKKGVNAKGGWWPSVRLEVL